jgi:hypothetical protein
MAVFRDLLLCLATSSLALALKKNPASERFLFA